MQNPESAVTSRYAEGAKAVETALCCPVKFDRTHLKVLPDEIIERDYGCGDPTPYVQEGDTVLDLGSGAGKICWIAAQVVGEKGRVIGVDMNTEMLSLARQHHDTIAERVGYDNVSYHRGMIQDLALDLDELGERLGANPISGTESWLALRDIEDELRREHTMIADSSVDVVLSNCVLNLVRPQDKRQLFEEIYRVVKTGGSVAISDIVADEDIPEEMQNDPELWSGCISGAYREDLFLEAFTEVGFHGVEIVKRDDQPWQTVNGIEFRAVTVRAFKGKAGPCIERNQALIYNGPFRSVTDDDKHTFVRGQRTAVCDKTYRLMQREPYKDAFMPVAPRVEVPIEDAGEFSCCRSTIRSAQETKGEGYRDTIDNSGPADPDSTDSSCC